MRAAALLLSLLAFVVAGSALSTARASSRDIDSARNWSRYFGNDQAWSYSALDQVDRSTVSMLSPVWAFATGANGLSATPLVEDGVMYLIAPGNRLFALDAATGRQIWSYAYPIADAGSVSRPGAVNGVALGFGLVFMPTLDNHLVAVDARTGHEVWDVQVDDPLQCRCRPSFAPVLAGDKVVIGATGESGPSKFIAAFDAKTGRQAWRFFTIPAPGNEGHESWAGESWKNAGAPTWYVGSYDPELNLVFWGTGNPGPAFHGASREGANLYSSSLIAIDADSGKLRWHYQHVPHDIWELDSSGEPTLIDFKERGRRIRAVLQGNKGGYAHLLDRGTGKYISAFAYADTITWTSGLDAQGRPRTRLETNLDAKLICPSGLGARAANRASYSMRTRFWYVSSLETCAMTRAVPPPQPGAAGAGAAQIMQLASNSIPHIAAYDPLTGKRKWSFATRGLHSSGLLTTGGGLMFGGDIFGEFFALDDETGRKLWSFPTGSGIVGGAISYAVNGRQYIAVASGWGDNAVGSAPAQYNSQFYPAMKAATPPAKAATLFVFALPETSR